MTVRLLNSAMIPCEGTYKARYISKEEFCLLLKEAYNKNKLISYIGYPQNTELIRKWTGIRLNLNRKTTTLNDGDIILVMKLKYRIENPSKKGKPVSEEDFEFMLISYKKEV